jgi:hypothetical protein
MNLPNFILIGVQKAGTTSLYDWIAQHPDVYGPKGMKDFPFFCNDEYYKNGLKWFSKFFRDHHGEKIIFHGYVNHIYNNMSAQRIYDYKKDIKLLLILRNPIERAYSAFWYMRKIGIETLKTFEEAIDIEDKRKSGNYRERNNLTYIDHGFYYKQLMNFYKFFSKSQIFIAFFEDIKENRENLIKKIYNFLEVDENFVPLFNVENPSGVPRIGLIQRILSKKIAPPYIKDLIPLDKRILIKDFLMNLNVKKVNYSPIKLETKRNLINTYRDEILRLEDLLGIDLSGWLEE